LTDFAFKKVFGSKEVVAIKAELKSEKQAVEAALAEKKPL
jgi:hypothetical protein